MQNRYTGDIGDFGKYGLLRFLCDPADKDRLRLGVVWCLADDETNSDGGKTGYLKYDRPGLRRCDPRLYDALYRIVESEKRSVKSVSLEKILHGDTRYFERSLSWPEASSALSAEAKETRLRFRRDWLAAARREVKDCELVFFDPDNGLAPPSLPVHSARAPKYIFRDEAMQFYGEGKSLVVYQHLDRSGKAWEQSRRKLDQLGAPGAFSLWYHRGTARLFLIAPSSKQQAELLREKCAHLCSGEWGRHFTLLE